MLIPFSTRTNATWITPAFTKELRRRGVLIHQMESLKISYPIDGRPLFNEKYTYDVQYKGNQHITWKTGDFII